MAIVTTGIESSLLLIPVLTITETLYVTTNQHERRRLNKI